MKRVFALVLCLCLVLACAPAAFAAETGNVTMGGNTYNTVEEALAAGSGTITLNDDVTAGQVIIPQGTTLDLNGKTLTADMIIVFNGAIVGNGGKIVVAKDMMKVIGDNNGQVPVWNAAESCYTFATVNYQQMMQVPEDLSWAKYIFIPNFDLNTIAMMADGGADNGVSIKVLLTWNNGLSQQIYTFSEEMVAQVYSSANASGVCAQVFQLTITGIEGITDMTACAVVESTAGGKAVNAESKVALPEPEPEPDPEPDVPTPDPEPEDPYAAQAAIMEQIKALAAGESISDVTLTGEITKINTAYDSTYKNVTVTIKVFGTEDTLKCYRIKGDAASILAVGDTITVNGVVKNYQHSSGDTELEFDSGSQIIEHIPVGGGSTDPEPEQPPVTPEEPTKETLTIAEAIALGAGMEKDNYTTEKYYVTGVITEVKNATYGNVYITDGEGNYLYVYGLNSADGSTRYDAMNPKPDEGDTVTLYGVIGMYTDPQMKAAWVIDFTPGELEEEEPDAEAVTIAFDNRSKRSTFTTSQQVWAENGITVTNNKGASTTNVADYAAPARFYKSSTVIVEYANGFTKIEFACNTASYATALKSSIKTGTVTVENTKVIVVLDAAATSFEVVLDGGQVRMDSLTVS